MKFDFLGKSLLGSIIEARGNVSVVDIRYLNKESCESWIDGQMRDFIYDAEMFNHIHGQNQLGPLILDLRLTNRAMTNLLNQPWNANLPGHENLAQQLRNLQDDVTPRSKKAKLDTKETFVRVTPKFEKIDREMCQFCDKSYLSQKALEAHRKKEHPDEKFKDLLPMKKDQITCRTCKPNRKLNRDQMITHLKRVHKIRRPEGK